jgi:anti-sigma regulatory factor (Ser/Thr protein kinase)
VWSFKIQLDNEPVNASRARAFVRRKLAEHDLSHLSDDVEVVVSELATNAMLHAHTPFTVSLHAFDQTLLLEVEDGSVRGDLRVRDDAAAPDFDTHGRGLGIVAVLSREWGVDSLPCGKSVWAEFDLE